MRDRRQHDRAFCSPDADEAAAERITAICEILAAGLMRLHARKSNQTLAEQAESSLDCFPVQSGHAARFHDPENGA